MPKLARCAYQREGHRKDLVGHLHEERGLRDLAGVARQRCALLRQVVAHVDGKRDLLSRRPERVAVVGGSCWTPKGRRALHAFLTGNNLPVATGFRRQAHFNGQDEHFVGDLGVGRRVKQMATGFYGRIAAYDAGMEGGDLIEALRRNAYGTVTIDEGPVARLASYLTEADQALAGQSTRDLAAGRVSFPPVA